MAPKKWEISGIPCNLFNEGENRVKIEAVRVPVPDPYKGVLDLDSDGFLDIDSMYLNWFEVDYRSKYITENGYYLKFSGTGNGATDFAISDFYIPTNDRGWIAVMDITGYPDKITRFNNIKLSDNFPYQVYFRDVLENNKKKEYVATVILTSPDKITKYNRSSNKWRNTANNADYVIITHEDIYDSAIRLAEYRKNQGLKAAVVKISEVYDEFSAGIFTPRAIKDFLAYAYTSWSLRPKYVALFGDANYDYKDNYQYGEPNMIPTYFVPGEFGLIPTDNWFVDVNGDVAPEMMIGRISVKNIAEANSVIDKIINYETAQDASWHKNVLFVADENDYVFEDLSDTLYLSLPPEYSATAKKVYMSNYYKLATDPEKAGEMARTDIAAIINSGTLMTIYTGHGDIDQWADERMIDSYYVSGWGTESGKSILSNYELPTFVMTLNCLNGFFPLPNEGGVKNKDEPNDIPLAEAFLKLDRSGAVAVWSPTSLGYTWEHEVLARHVFDAVFKEGINVVGEAILKAKTTAYPADNISKDIIYMYTLFGDPATRLHLSGNPAGGGSLSSGSNKDSGSGCFIATAAYGSPLHPYLKYLRDFRDTYLMTNNPGRAFVYRYYRYSPPVAQYIAERPLLRMFISITLLPLVGVAWLFTTFHPIQIAIAFLLFAGVVMGGIFLSRRFISTL